DLQRAGALISGNDEERKALYLVLPGNVRSEISTARTERYEKVGKPPIVSPATIIEDLKRRDFTANAMALSLNPGSRGLLMDPYNGAADIEAKVLRILHNYAFVEEPSRLIRATRFAARFHWTVEERTQARFESAKENNYIDHISSSTIGYEIEQLAYEDDPLLIARLLEKEGWLKVLNAHWSTAKVDAPGLSQLLKTRQQMTELGYIPDVAASVLYFLTAKLAEKEIAAMRKLIPRKDLVEAWRNIEDEAKSFAKRLAGKEASSPSRAWKMLSEARPDLILFLAVAGRPPAAAQKIKNFFTKWRQVQQKIPLAEMTELNITPQMAEYPKIANEVFMLLLDGKLRSHTEIMKFLKPLAPPPPPPPPPVPAKRGRAAKSAAAAAPAGAMTAATPKGKRKSNGAEIASLAVAAVAKPVTPEKPATSAAAKKVSAATPKPTATKKAKAAPARSAKKESGSQPNKKKGKPAQMKSKSAKKKKR
ncbi:MAG: CCA tRNA nucleotidyltransferase, partial [Acidobacteriales bacterium]|nr:CCA tRNA nucleotidyltransferase [Terriglobales bacterium]